MREFIKRHPKVGRVIASNSSSWARDKGREVLDRVLDRTGAGGYLVPTDRAQLYDWLSGHAATALTTLMSAYGFA